MINNRGWERMFTLENFLNGLNKTLPHISADIYADTIILTRCSRNYETDEIGSALIGNIPVQEVDTILLGLTTDRAMYNDNFLYRPRSFEIPVKMQGQVRMMSYRFFDHECYKVSEHNYELYISKASMEYAVALLCSVSQFDFSPIEVPPYRTRFEGITSLENLFEAIRILTVKITAPVDTTQADFKRMLHSYLFNIAYCKNAVFSTLNFTDSQQLVRRGMRREGQLFPYKNYNIELVKYYYQGVSTDIPFSQYLAFYHVAEFYFQTIAEQDAFQEIESFITRPSFSPYRKEDVRQFYNRIKKKLRDQREDGVWDERTGLLLCLKKYVPDLLALQEAITSIDPSAIEYYKNTDVPFADGGNRFDFNDNQDAVYTKIRNRIYSVRNAIVHSKEGERLRYEPFKNDRALMKEIPLIRAAAEEIIINSAKPLEITNT